MDKIAPYYKAIVGALVAAISAAIPIVDDGVTTSEGLSVALAFIVGLGVVYAVPNKDHEPRHDKGA